MLANKKGKNRKRRHRLGPHPPSDKCYASTEAFTQPKIQSRSREWREAKTDVDPGAAAINTPREEIRIPIRSATLSARMNTIHRQKRQNHPLHSSPSLNVQTCPRPHDTLCDNSAGTVVAHARYGPSKSRHAPKASPREVRPGRPKMGWRDASPTTGQPTLHNRDKRQKQQTDSNLPPGFQEKITCTNFKKGIYNTY